MLEQLFIEISQQSLWEWIALFSGIVYVLLAAKNNFICWFFGILSCGIFVFVSYYKYALFADAALNFLYVLLGFQGLCIWWQGSDQEETEVKSIDKKTLLIHVISGLLISYVIHFLLKEYTVAAATGLDAITTVFSIIATIWLVHKYRESWLLFVFVDIIYIGLYLSREAYLFAILFVVYTVVAMIAWRSWRKLVQS